MKRRLQQIALIVLALLLSMLLGILVARASADGPVLWKQYCPRHHEVRLIKDRGPSITVNRSVGVTVLCVRMAEVDDADPS